MRSPPLWRKTSCEKHDLVQSGKSSLKSWPDVKLIPQTNKRKSALSHFYAKYADIFEKQTPTLLSGRVYISIDFILRPTTPHTSWKTGAFVGFIFKAFLHNHGCFTPEKTVEYYTFEKVWKEFSEEYESFLNLLAQMANV